MARKITINEDRNPTGLTMSERQLCLDLIQSIRSSVAKLRSEDSRSRRYWRRERTPDDEREIWDRVMRVAINQIAGRQKTEKGLFDLKLTADADDRDLEFVMKSILQSQS
jgi:hypothetical protein